MRPAMYRSRLIYPAPVEAGLGIHVTIDLAGQVRFGPDVEWVDLDSVEKCVEIYRRVAGKLCN